MKLLLSIIIIVALLIVDGTLTYDPFGNYSLGDLPGLLLILFIFGWIAWAEHTKKNKNDRTQT